MQICETGKCGALPRWPATGAGSGGDTISFRHTWSSGWTSKKDAAETLTEFLNENAPFSQATAPAGVEPGAVEKTCVLCGHDCSDAPRVMDEANRYYHQSCYDAARNVSGVSGRNFTLILLSVLLVGMPRIELRGEDAEERDRFDALSEIDAETFEAAWKVNMNVAEQPAAEVLAMLLGRVGMQIHPGEHATTLNEPVTLDLHDVSIIEAVERVSSAVGLHPEYPNRHVMNRIPPGSRAPPANAVQFRSGPRQWPVDFVGPFMVSVTGLKENVPFTTGNIRITAESLGIPGSVLSLMAEFSRFFEIGPIFDSDGGKLNAVENLMVTTRPQIVGAYTYEEVDVGLKKLLRHVERIETVNGTVRVVLPGRITQVKLDSLEEGASVTADDLNISILELDSARTMPITRLEITGGEQSESNWVVRLAPSDEKNRPMQVMSDSTSRITSADGTERGSVARVMVQTHQVPATLRMKIVRTHQTLTFPFELSPIPLAHFREMPASLPELEFGDRLEPVSFEFIRFVRRGAHPHAELKITNHANKPVARLEMRLIYLDASGVELKDSPQTASRPGPTMIVDAFSETLSTQPAFFAPDETESVRVKLRRVVFADGTIWSVESTEH